MRSRLLVLLGASLSVLAACSGSDSTTTATTSSTGGTTATTAGSGGGAAQGGAGGAASAGGGAQGGAGGGSTERPTTPDPKFLPKPTGACPEFAKGTLTFAPTGIAARKVDVWVDPAAAKAGGGPIVLVWHGMGGSASDATYILGSKQITAITKAGGVVASLHEDPAAGQFPWWAGMGGNRMDDMLVADEIVGCALENLGADPKRIHSIGFSAGAMQTEQLAEWRSGYIASIVAFSGARMGTPTDEDPRNKYPAMLFFGGKNDQVLINFADASHTEHDKLTAEGRFSFLCDHGQGHTVPADGPAAAWQFLEDHPFGVVPEPYAAALPATMPKYCALD
jgi:predicted esterase